jgi:thymidylate synthase (FAD)
LDFELGDDILWRIERAGRTCYQSEDANHGGDPDKTQEFVRKIIKRGHESVLEHEKVTVSIVCDRGVSHELVRHRLASYSQESTRYCNYNRNKFGSAISVIDITSHMVGTAPLQEWCEAMHDAERHYFKLLELGCKPEIARSVLPNSLKTEIVVTANLREWRHIFKLRTAKAAHPQMREIMVPLLVEFKRTIPVVFEDIEPEA